MSKPFTVRDADWPRDADALRHVRRAVSIAEQRVPEDMEWDDDDATGQPAARAGWPVVNVNLASLACSPRASNVRSMNSTPPILSTSSTVDERVP